MRKASLLVLAICFLLINMTEASIKQSHLILRADQIRLGILSVLDLDNSPGIQIVHEHVDHQSYVTELTPTKAEEVKQMDFIQSLHEQGKPREVRSNRAVPSSRLDDEEFVPRT